MAMNISFIYTEFVGGGYMIIEVCVSSIDDVKHAVDHGATRIELCTAMEVLGVTPSISNFDFAKEITDVEILAYIRPRPGDFVYTDTEFEVMKRDIVQFYNHGARAFVFGILNSDNTIDLKRTQELMQCIPSDVEFIIHKAFDFVPNFDQAINDLIKLKFRRILTSGGIGGSLDNIQTLKYLSDKYGNDIEIMPGGGVTSETVEEIIRVLNPQSIHLSAKKTVDSNLSYIKTDTEELRKVVDIALALETI